MSTLRMKMFLAAGMSAAVLGTAGFGLIAANADTPTKAKEKVVALAPAAPVEAVADKAAPPKKPGIPAPIFKSETAVRDALNQPLGELAVDGILLRELLELLHEKHGVIARIDTAAFKRMNAVNETGMETTSYYGHELKIPVTRGMTVADLLGEAVAQLPGNATYRIRGGQIIIVPAYIPPVAPGAVDVNSPIIPQAQLSEQLHGEPVSFVADGKSLADAVRELRKLTGANIVIDARFRDKAKIEVDGSFNDTRLLTVLQVLGDMADLKPVTLNNVFYLTDAKNAEKLQKQVNRELFGESGNSAPTAPAAVNAETQKAQHFVEVVKGLLHNTPAAPPEAAPTPPADPAALKEAVKEALKELLAKPAQP